MTWLIRIILLYTILLWVPFFSINVFAKLMTFILILLYAVSELEVLWRWRAKALKAEKEAENAP